MQFSNTLLKLATLVSAVMAEGELCNANHSGPKQRCTIQFKSDQKSLAKFEEITGHLKKMECSWISPSDLTFSESGHITSNLPAGFVDTVLAKMPQYQPYVESKNCS
ncbi:hypothetical protein DSO57_1013438 [Entomophthora muscae]|uniref:Uncharacterized protein n=1 Tax=Entomophthora muscae TaxID=34485 RepID=A0ACC2TUA9_9FUNG|nr:hypothetical protein DSO57_1013438 [Entomophthora muscae]